MNYWTGWSGFEFDALASAWLTSSTKRIQNIYVNMTTVFGQYEKVLTAIAGGNPPDVVSAVWLDQLVQVASLGALTPLTALPKKPALMARSISRSCGTTGGITASFGV